MKHKFAALIFLATLTFLSACRATAAERTAVGGERAG